MALILLIVVNVGVFLLMGASTGEFDWSARTLLAWGGNLGALTFDGQPWRLLTSQYLHANLTHIFGNMALLAITGAYVEAKVGPARLLVVYTLCGIVGALLSAWGDPHVVGVGASGAIAGLVGIMVAFYWSDRGPEISGGWLLQTVGINAAYSLAPNVDWRAHLGGFLAGLFCGAALLALYRAPAE